MTQGENGVAGPSKWFLSWFDRLLRDDFRRVSASRPVELLIGGDGRLLWSLPKTCPSLLRAVQALRESLVTFLLPFTAYISRISVKDLSILLR